MLESVSQVILQSSEYLMCILLNESHTARTGVLESLSEAPNRTNFEHFMFFGFLPFVFLKFIGLRDWMIYPILISVIIGYEWLIDGTIDMSRMTIVKDASDNIRDIVYGIGGCVCGSLFTYPMSVAEKIERLRLQYLEYYIRFREGGVGDRGLDYQKQQGIFQKKLKEYLEKRKYSKGLE